MKLESVGLLLLLCLAPGADAQVPPAVAPALPHSCIGPCRTQPFFEVSQELTPLESTFAERLTGGWILGGMTALLATNVDDGFGAAVVIAGTAGAALGVVLASERKEGAKYGMILGGAVASVIPYALAVRWVERGGGTALPFLFVVSAIPASAIALAQAL